jgi:hypothetical protein
MISGLALATRRTGSAGTQPTPEPTDSSPVLFSQPEATGPGSPRFYIHCLLACAASPVERTDFPHA